MAQPPAYVREFNFASYQASNPSEPLPGSHVDAEFNRIKLTTDRVRQNLAMIQQDDGELRNLIVSWDKLTADLKAQLTLSGFDPDSAPAASNGVAELVGLDGNGHTVRMPFSETNVKTMGAVGDGATDDTAAIQAAFDAGGVIRLPGGTYRIPSAGSRLVFKADTTLIFDFGAVIFFDDDAAATNRPLFSVDISGANYDITLVNPIILGTWGDGSDYTQGSHFMELNIAGRFRSTGGYFSKCRFMTMVVKGAASAEATGNWLNIGRRDGIRFIDCLRNTITDNICDKIMDDSIAVHTTDAATAPVHLTCVVANNTIRDGQGMALLGLKNFTISGNTLERIQTRAIYIGTEDTTGDPTEGNTPVTTGTIIGNVIDTVFDGFALIGAGGSANHYITVSTKVPTTNGSGYSEQRDGSGGVVAPHAYLFTNNTDAVAPNIGSRNIVIADNICMRSYKPTTLYSDYGLGSRMTTAGPVDVAVTTAMLGIDPAAPRPQINILKHLANAIIANNVLNGGGEGIVFNGTNASAYISWKDVLVIGNRVINYVRRGCAIRGTGLVEIHNTLFDADPLHINAQRVANGKWSTGNTVCAIYFDGGYGVIKGCSFKNMQVIAGGGGETWGSWANNTVFAAPVAMGFNANNIGIGTPQYNKIVGANAFIVEDGDPASTTFGTVLNVCLTAASSIPTTGLYPEAWFVEDRGSTVTGGTRRLGWLRRNTGSGHTLNTDWFEVWTQLNQGLVSITDGVTAPGTVSGFGQIYIDTADGDLKIKYGDGTVKTIVVDT